tara:strand:+ start:260 stop:409 length:150 start_codon:yes stop_codon:yes gene_type:complete
MKINWINSWNAGNKKEVYELSFRLGTLTILEASYGSKFRFMILNFGFEL